MLQMGREDVSETCKLDKAKHTIESITHINGDISKEKDEGSCRMVVLFVVNKKKLKNTQ